MTTFISDIQIVKRSVFIKIQMFFVQTNTTGVLRQKMVMVDELERFTLDPYIYFSVPEICDQSMYQILILGTHPYTKDSMKYII